MARSRKPTVWIEKRKANGGWTYRVRAEKDGVRLPDVVCGPRREHAERVRDRMKAELWEGKLGITRTEQRPLGRFIEEYLEHASAHKASATVKNFEAPALRSLLEHLGPERALEAISREDVEEWKLAQLGAGLAPHTVAMRLRSAKTALAHAVRLKLLRENPVAGVRSPRTEAVGRLLLASEIEALLQRLPVLVARACWHDLNSGLRLSEIEALDWRNVDTRQLPWAGTVKGKGGRTRVVHFNAAARSVMGTPRESGPVFAGLTRHMIHSHLASACRTLKLGRIRFHDFRHTWATEYMRRTGDLPGLMLEGGWTTLAAVRVYQHLSRSRAEAVETVDFGVSPPILPPNGNG